MAALRRICVGLVVLVLGLLGAAWAVPPLLDWERYRDEVAGLASAALGQDVRIEGAITLRLLPQPLLVAKRVSVVAGTAGAGVTAEQLLVRVGLGSLLAGRVDARELVLRGAEIRLPWPMEPAALALRTPSWLSSLSARIERGRLWLGELEVTGVEATLATSDVSGSFRSAGRAQGGGHGWVFTARVSRPGGDGAVGIDVTLDGQGAAQGIGVVVGGQMQGDGSVAGRVAVRGPDLSQLLPVPAVAFRLDGRLSSGGGLVAVDGVAGELAGSPVQGAVALRWAPRLRLDVALTASRLDLDAWLPAVMKGGARGLPGGAALGLDLSAEAAGLAGGTLRGLRGAFDIADGAVVVREARAVVPGDAALRLSGRMAAGEGGALRFDGDVQLEAPALRTTLAWAARAGLGPVDALPAGVLSRAEVGGKLAVEGGQLVLSGLAGVVDGAGMAADLSWQPGPRPSLRATVAVEQLALDPWLAGGWPGLPGLAGVFGPLSLDLQLEAARAAWRGTALSGLVLQLSAEPGRVAVRRLAAEGLGAVATASGTVLEGGRVVEARAELRAERAEGLAPLLAALLGSAVSVRLGPLLPAGIAVQVQAGGAPEALGVKLAGTLGDLAVEATPTLDVPGGRWGGVVTLRHPGAPRLAEMLGMAGAAGWLGDGSFALVAQAAGGAERIVAERFELVAGGMRAGGALRLERGALPKLTGQIVAERLMLPLVALRSPDPWPLAALMGWEAGVQLTAGQVAFGHAQLLDAVRASVTLAGGRLELAGLTAKLGGGSLAGALSLDASARPPALAVQAQWSGAAVSGSLFDAPLDITGGTLDGSVRLTAAGFSPAGLLASLAGRVAIAGQDGVLAGIDLARMGTRLEEHDLRAALAGGGTGFERLLLEGDIERGGLALTRAAMSGPAGSVAASGTIDLGRAMLALRLAIAPAVPDAPEIGLRISGPVNAPERVPELAGAVRWRAEHP